MENTVSGSDGGLLSDHVHRSGLGSHAKLERQGSKGSKGCPTPSQKIHSPLAHRAETNKQSEDLHGPIRTVGSQPYFTPVSQCFSKKNEKNYNQELVV